MFNVDKLDKKYQSEFNSNDTLQLVAFSILLVFLGLRTGMGVAVKSKLKNHGLKLKNIIQFEDGEKQK